MFSALIASTTTLENHSVISANALNLRASHNSRDFDEEMDSQLMAFVQRGIDESRRARIRQQQRFDEQFSARQQAEDARYAAMQQAEDARFAARIPPRQVASTTSHEVGTAAPSSHFREDGPFGFLNLQHSTAPSSVPSRTDTHVASAANGPSNGGGPGGLGGPGELPANLSGGRGGLGGISNQSGGMINLPGGPSGGLGGMSSQQGGEADSGAAASVSALAPPPAPVRMMTQFSAAPQVSAAPYPAAAGAAALGYQPTAHACGSGACAFSSAGSAAAEPATAATCETSQATAAVVTSIPVRPTANQFDEKYGKDRCFEANQILNFLRNRLDERDDIVKEYKQDLGRSTQYRRCGTVSEALDEIEEIYRTILRKIESQVDIYIGSSGDKLANILRVSEQFLGMDAHFRRSDVTSYVVSQNWLYEKF